MPSHTCASHGITALALLFTCALAGCDGPVGPNGIEARASAAAVDPGRYAIETGIVPAVTFVGADALSLESQLAAYDVPAVSIAVVRDGEIAWAAAYGEDVDAASLFQAASLSKTVAAAGILALARERGFDIDADLTGDLGAFDLAAVNPDARPVSLRRLLSHTAGATVQGFPGYPAGTPLPDTLELVGGSERTNTPAVEISFDPDNAWRYSGGGFEIAQLWAEQASGEDFAELMQRLVLDPVGMPSSSFALNWPETFAEGGVARAHGWDGEPIAGGWHLHPEQAAAGLWTTPSDYARFLIALMAAADGQTGRGIEPGIAQMMTTAIASDYGLGIGTGIHLGERRLDHGGGNEGYRCQQLALPDRGDAIVVMTNGNNAINLIADINRTAEIAYDWPHNETRTEQISPQALAGFAGTYTARGEDQPILRLEATDADLRGVFYGRIHFRLVPIGEARFVDPVDAEDFRFTPEDGVMVARTATHEFTRLRDLE